VRTDLAAGLWLAQADPHQVESAILNLAINARDAMQQGGGQGAGLLVITTANVWRRADVTLIQRDDRFVPIDDFAPGAGLIASDPAGDGEFVMIAVGDTGSGMAQEVLGRVFEPFFTTKPTGQGSGLGLSQVHGLAAQSGGEVQVLSAPGTGTLVRLLLPRATLAATSDSDTSPRTRRAAARHTVLLVDDNEDVRRLTSDMLTELGHRPIPASCGDEALDLLQQNPDVDVLVTDLAMPGLSGLEVVLRARALRPGLRTLIVTGVVDVGAPGLAECDVILRKPFSLDGLATAVDQTRVVALI
jgi:CheY-like chemotaxis protein